MYHIYKPLKVEKKIQKQWDKNNIFKAYEYAINKKGTIKKKFYTCSMIPYPSGKLHIGHVRNYTINDVMYRYLRMNGFNVFMPMGWDAFGLPAENAAIFNKISPYVWTNSNIKYMKKQIKSIGLSIDWSREINSCNSKYYYWNQWIFLKMFKKGIIYKKKGIVNWDPIDKTVLANEQIINGRGWRSGALIEKKSVPMYYVKITKYASKLLKNINNKLYGWPKKVIEMQKNWIGMKNGINIALLHNLFSNKKLLNNGKLWIFVKQIEILINTTFCILTINHKLINYLIKKNKKLKIFVKKNKNKIYKKDIYKIKKKGMFTGLLVYNPLTNKKIQIWVVNYINLNNKNTISISTPINNKNDYFFAKKYELPIKNKINFKNQKYSLNSSNKWYKNIKDNITISYNKYNKHNNKFFFLKIIKQITNNLIKKKLAKKTIKFNLRDWGISRQRYWGTPIPIIYCSNCGEIPVPKKKLPIVLPKKCIPNGINNPLNKNKKFLQVICYKCGKIAKRETDTMDTFIDSSWYYIKYASIKNEKFIINQNNNYWMPIDYYIGGIEHAILHLLYSRFWIKVMKDFKLIKFDEPFTKLLTQGMVLNETYYRICKITNKKEWFNPEDVKNIYNNKGEIISSILKNDNKIVEKGNIEKMSKSKNNGIDPQNKIKNYGADTIRLFIIFTAPLEQNLIWSIKGIEGSNRFLHKLWKFCFEKINNIKIKKKKIFKNFTYKEKKFQYKIYNILKNINYDYKRIYYNTVVSYCMKMFNIIEEFSIKNTINNKFILYKSISILIRLLYPIAPHITSIIWQKLKFINKYGNIVDAPWPQINKNILKYKIYNKFNIYINSKLYNNIIFYKNTNQNIIKKFIIKNKNLKNFFKKKNILKIIIIPKKIINIIIQ